MLTQAGSLNSYFACWRSENYNVYVDARRLPLRKVKENRNVVSEGELLMRLPGIAGALFIGWCSFGPAAAFAAPAELVNKTITVSYTTTIPGKSPDGQTITGVRNAVRTVYVSSAGRVFARVFRRDRDASATKEAGPGDSGNTFRFEGNKLVGVMQFVSGAVQMVITWDAGGQNCNATIQAGRDNGRPLQWKGVNGKTYTATGPAQQSNINCSIAAGNAFAGQ